jgi:hypothetical protein
MGVEQSVRKDLEKRIKELRREADQLEGVVRKLSPDAGAPSRPTRRPSAAKRTRKASKGGRRSSLTVDALVGAFNGNDGSLSAAQLRERLSLPKSVSDFVLRQRLAEAVDAGSLKREGVARSTRYFKA